MADDDSGTDGPSLEPPSLGLFRKRRRKSERAPEPAPAAAPPPEEPHNDEPAPSPVRVEPDEAPTEVVPAVQPEPEPQPRPEPEPDPDRAEDEQPTTVLATQPPAAPPLFADEAPRGTESGGPGETAVLAPIAGATAATDAPSDDETSPAGRQRKRPQRPRRQRTPRATPLLTGVAAVLVTGLLVGLGTVGLTAGGMQACEAARGTPACGGSGLVLLLLILAAMVLLGGWLLRTFRIPDPGSTSFLAVGLLTVVALVFLIDHLLEWWMVIVIPLVSVATYALSHWVTVSVIEPARE